MENENKNKNIDIAGLREKLKGQSGERYWKSLEELSGTEEFKEWAQNEFPQEPSVWERSTTRRTFLQ